ncbi:MAG: hypothetical protein ACREMP_09190 [Candidatus Tyrphobacter sp.]
MVSFAEPVIVAATVVEARAVRAAAPRARVLQCGVAFSGCDPAKAGDTVISCGLCGGLRDDLPTGSVVVADRVRRPNGDEFVCDRALVLQLTVAARKLGYEPVVAPVVTTSVIVSGVDRARWAALGYAAADMESGLIVAQRIGVVRVVLDTPQRELSRAWAHPAQALANPLLWPQAMWLRREAPRCAAISAAVVAAAVGQTPPGFTPLH